MTTLNTTLVALYGLQSADFRRVAGKELES